MSDKKPKRSMLYLAALILWLLASLAGGFLHLFIEPSELWKLLFSIF